MARRNQRGGRVVLAVALAAAVVGGGTVWAADGWFSDVPDDHRRIEAIRYAKAEGLFQGFPDGRFGPDAELSEEQFVKVAKRLYDRYDVWTRAEWAQVLYAGLPALTVASTTTTTEAPMMMVSDDCAISAPDSAVTINMIGWTFDIMEFYADELEKCNGENVEVNTQLLQYQDARDQMLLDLTSGGTSAYEIVHGANGEISEFGSQGLVVRLNDLVEKYWDEYNLGDISQTAWDGATFDGGIYGVPVVSNTQHLMYRPDLYEKYGLSVPASYDDVINSCNVMRDEASIDLPFVMNLHAGSAWDVWFLHFFRGFGGGNYLNPDNTPAVNSPEGVAAVAKIKEVIDACMGAQGLTYDYNAVQLGLQTGGVASSTLWASRAAAMDNPDESDFVGGIEFAVAPSPMPGGPAGASAWNDFLMIPASSDVDPEIIFQIIMEATDAESQLGAAEVGIFGIPTRDSAANAGVGGRYLPAAAESVANGIGFFAPNPAVRLMRNALGNQLPLVGTGEKTPEQALSDAVDEYLIKARDWGFLSAGNPY